LKSFVIHAKVKKKKYKERLGSSRLLNVKKAERDAGPKHVGDGKFRLPHRSIGKFLKPHRLGPLNLMWLTEFSVIYMFW
jgi:hypothetical protein